MARLSYKIYSLGCKVNQYDGDKLGGLLKSAGFILAKDNADLAIVNSCAVTASAIAKSRAMVKKARQENPHAKIILAGCWPRIYVTEAKELGIDLVWTDKDYFQLAEKLNHELGIMNYEREKKSLFKIHNSVFKKCGIDENIVSEKCAGDKSRYFLKIQDGCEQFCSYCIIPYTRGKLQSRPMAEVIAEAEAAVRAGWQEIVLNGIHLGLYGINNVGNIPSPSARRGHPSQGGDENLLGLLKKMVKIEDLKRIRLSSIEVTEVGDKLIKFMAKEKKMCRHLHVPLQAGSDKILKLMKRPYDLKYFADKIKKIRKKMPDIAISTDVIVGFPGETDRDFQDAEKFIKKIKFSRLHVFSFSAHERTAAFKMPDRVKPEIIKRRSEILRKLSDELARIYEKTFAGKILEVVVEQNRSSRTGKLKGEKMKGKTQYYFDIYFDKKNIISLIDINNDFIGKVIKIKSIGVN
jgi:threonylcarbamoyladenosine tRNA methylthiotransferase MtaB